MVWKENQAKDLKFNWIEHTQCIFLKWIKCEDESDDSRRLIWQICED